MSFESSNRFTGLDADPALVSTSRSPAQQEASRNNGRRSRGPRSATGRARSKLSSLRHGLLAKVITPQVDYLRNDQLYRSVRQKLVEQFRPATFTAEAAVDCLANDYVRLTKVHRMLESLAEAPRLSDREESIWGDLIKITFDLKLMQRAVTACDAPKSLRIPVHQAERLTSRLLEALVQVETNLADAAASQEQDAVDPADEQDLESPPDNPNSPHAGDTNNSPNQPGVQDPLDAQEQAELRPQQELVNALGPAVAGFRDRENLEAILTGRRRPRKTEKQALRVLLAYVLQSWQRWIKDHQELVARKERLDAAATKALAMEPERLMLLERHRRTIEREIERKTLRLQRK